MENSKAISYLLKLFSSGTAEGADLSLRTSMTFEKYNLNLQPKHLWKDAVFLLLYQCVRSHLDFVGQVAGAE